MFNGYVDPKEETIESSSLNFGVNNFTFKTLTASKSLGKEENKVGLDVNLSFGPNTTLFASIVEPEDSDKIKGVVGLVSNLLSLFHEAEKIEKALNKSFPSWKAYIKTVHSLLPQTLPKREFQVFLEWQWKITKKDKTFLKVPSKVTNGRLVYSPVMEGQWTEVRDKNGLHFINEKEEKHPFARDVWYTKQTWANRIVMDSNDDESENKGSSFGGDAEESSFGGDKKVATEEDDDLPF